MPERAARCRRASSRSAAQARRVDAVAVEAAADVVVDAAARHPVERDLDDVGIAPARRSSIVEGGGNFGASPSRRGACPWPSEGSARPVEDVGAGSSGADSTWETAPSWARMRAAASTSALARSPTWWRPPRGPSGTPASRAPGRAGSRCRRRTACRRREPHAAASRPGPSCREPPPCRPRRRPAAPPGRPYATKRSFM